MLKDMNFDDPEFEAVDNCYAESKNADPTAKIGKQYVDQDTQSFGTSLEYNNLLGGGEMMYSDTPGEKRKGKSKSKLGRGRG